MPPQEYYKNRSQSLYESYIKRLAIKQAIAEQKNNVFEHYITKHLSFKFCNN